MHKRIKTKKVKNVKNVKIIIMITLYYDNNKKGKELKSGNYTFSKINQVSFVAIICFSLIMSLS